jgi:LysM repeat protein
MLRLRFILLLLLVSAFFASPAHAQGDAAELQALTKKIDEQNTKIDALSQQILKLEHEIGQMTGTPVAPAASAATEENSSPAPVAAGGSTHIVARGETLTSIARQYKVGIAELQKFNHIENDRKLQIGQTLAIPGTQSPTPTASPNE